LHTQSSNIQIDLNTQIDPLIKEDDNLIICADHNMYKPYDKQYQLADTYINKPVADHIDIITNAKYIYVVNSCFSSIILPLLNMGQLKAIEYSILIDTVKKQLIYHI